MVVNDVVRLERDGWQALATGPTDAQRFYESTLAGEVVMVFPGGMVLTDRGQLVESMGGAPWSSFAIEDERVLELGPSTTLVTYRALANREGQTEYRAICTSAYVREGSGWKLAFHQQTPY